MLKKVQRLDTSRYAVRKAPVSREKEST